MAYLRSWDCWLYNIMRFRRIVSLMIVIWLTGCTPIAKLMDPQLGRYVDGWQSELQGTPNTGDGSAPVKIIVFSDFQCTHCSTLNGTLSALLSEYPGKVQLFYKHLPLGFHKNAARAARASYAAGKQGKFIEAKNLIFARQSEIDSRFLDVELPKELALDGTRFEKDINSAESLNTVNRDTALAKRWGIPGVPGCVVNGQVIYGAYPITVFRGFVDKHLMDPVILIK